MKTCYQTDPGKVRIHNEDSVTIVKNLKGEYLLVVADGMGGHKAGEIASSLVVTELGKRFSELSSIGTKEDAVMWLKEIIDEIRLNFIISLSCSDALNAHSLAFSEILYSSVFIVYFPILYYFFFDNHLYIFQYHI